MANLADRLTLAMSRRGCSATQIAGALTEAGIPITRAYVSLLKSGKQTNPTLAVVRAIAAYLQVSVGWLIGEEVLPAQLGHALAPADGGQTAAESLSPESMTALQVVFNLALRADQHEPDPTTAQSAPMPPSLNPAQRNALGARLRALRQAAGVSLEQAGQTTGSMPIEDLEAGRAAAPPATAVEQLLTRYGVHDTHQREHILSLARADRDPDWFDHPHVPLSLAARHGLEHQAALLRTYHAQQIPTWLQTEQYARAALTVTDSAIDHLLACQALLARPQPPRLWAVIDEAALLRRVADAHIQVAQLDALIQAAKQPTVTVQILPVDGPACGPATGPFTLLQFAEPFRADLLCEHALSGDRLLSDLAQVDAYNVVFARLSVASATREESLQLLHAHRQRASDLLGG